MLYLSNYEHPHAAQERVGARPGVTLPCFIVLDILYNRHYHSLTLCAFLGPLLGGSCQAGKRILRDRSVRG